MSSGVLAERTGDDFVITRYKKIHLYLHRQHAVTGGERFCISSIVFLHILGVFGFLLAHGVWLLVAFRVQGEKDIHAIRALLGLSASAVMASFFSLLVLLIGGIGAGFVGRWWSFGWIWAALGVFVLVDYDVGLYRASFPSRATSGGLHGAARPR